MGALDELLKVPYEKATSLQKALLVLFEDEVGYEALAGEAAAELAALTERVGRLEWVVKRLEFIEEYPSEDSLCPICRGEKPTHYEDCELAAALQEAQ